MLIWISYLFFVGEVDDIILERCRVDHVCRSRLKWIIEMTELMGTIIESEVCILRDVQTKKPSYENKDE
jgi:hypothetical protein